ncbi:oxygenase MpaB family protein [Rhodococcus sp. IEGM 1408]|uniref:oxygenase MpaB family protein n=1 Tax=Rhodococcus sp. IEGM 1408 TaxID=3082220 RepID=UPI00295410A6|nr:oxygenase MpaB family protein [Rhodococcus sp. IEGM 1408]MDV8000014.1 oxygenase MpaB family protein [Rhodococcus sp. IEGM 1408]
MLTDLHRNPATPVARAVPPAITDAADSIGAATGAANVIMQLSWPEVGWGVRESRVDSGNVYKRPLKRARTTFQYLAVATLGSDDDKRAYREEVTRIHRLVFSTPESRVKYSALDPRLQMWVAACLYVGFEDVYEWLYGPMTDSDREAFYQSAPSLGTTLQVRPEQWPATREEFDDYWRDGMSRIHFDEPVRRHLVGIAELRMLPQPTTMLFGKANKWLTTGFLRSEFRDALGLPWNPQDQRRFEAFLAATAAVNRLLPRVVRTITYRVLLIDLKRRLDSGRPLM